MDQSLHDKIRKVTPNRLKDRLVVPGRELDYDYEAARKYGLSRFWGYSYPDYRQTRNPEVHYKNCIRSLDSMESQLRDLFSGFQIKDGDRADVPFKGGVWTEENTMPLFEEAYRKARIVYNIFGELARGLLRLVKSEHKKSCSILNDISGDCGDIDPKTERILVWNAGDKREIRLSVSPDRYSRRYLYGVGLIVCERGQRLYCWQHLPILLQFNGFDNNDTKFRELHERLATTDFSPLKREFPFVPKQTDIECDKFRQLIQKHADKGEYAKSSSARFTVEDALTKGVLTFEQAEQLIPGLFSGEITHESEIIKGLFSE